MTAKIIKLASRPCWRPPPVPRQCVVCHDVGEPCGCVLRARLERVQGSWWRRVLWWAVTR